MMKKLLSFILSLALLLTCLPLAAADETPAYTDTFGIMTPEILIALNTSVDEFMATEETAACFFATLMLDLNAQGRLDLCDVFTRAIEGGKIFLAFRPGSDDVMIHVYIDGYMATANYMVLGDTTSVVYSIETSDDYTVEDAEFDFTAWGQVSTYTNYWSLNGESVTAALNGIVN